MRRALIIGWLTALWLILWRDISIANLLGGLVLAGVASSGVSAPRGSPRQHSVRPVALAGFVVYFAWKLVEANLVLAREVVTPQNRIHTGIVAVPMRDYSDFVVTIVANAISLTPGTLTLEVRRTPEPVIYVHVLHLHDLDDVRAEVVSMARRAAASFPQVASSPVTTEIDT